MNFYLFDIDLDAITLIVDPILDMVKMYVYTQNEVPSSASWWLWLSVLFVPLLCTISMMFTSSACMGVASIQKLVNHKGLCNSKKKPVVSRPNILSKPNYKMF